MRHRRKQFGTRGHVLHETFKGFVKLFKECHTSWNVSESLNVSSNEYSLNVSGNTLKSTRNGELTSNSPDSGISETAHLLSSSTFTIYISATFSEEGGVSPPSSDALLNGHKLSIAFATWQKLRKNNPYDISRDKRPISTKNPLACCFPPQDNCHVQDILLITGGAIRMSDLKISSSHILIFRGATIR